MFGSSVRARFAACVLGLTAMGAVAQTPINQLVLNRGTLDFKSGGDLLTGLGYASLCPQKVAAHQLQLLLAPDRADLARIVVPLGDDIYKHCGDSPMRSTYFGKNAAGQEIFDFGRGGEYQSLVWMVRQWKAANPNIKFIIQVAVDGSQKFMQEQALPQQDTSPRGAWFTASHLPDYRSAAWRAWVQRGLEALVQQVQASDFAANVIGYQLFYGKTMDGNPFVNLHAPEALAEFRTWLREKYSKDEQGNPDPTNALNRFVAAWDDSSLNFDNVLPVEVDRVYEKVGDRYVAVAHPRPLSPAQTAKALAIAPLFAPGTLAPLADTRAFKSWVIEQIAFDFAKHIKNASQRNALVGVRGGEFLAMPWKNEQDVTEHAGHRSMAFFTNPDIDFYEVWDQYGPNRHSESSERQEANVSPLMSVQGLQLLGKKYVFQNDYRVTLPNWMKPADAKNGNGVLCKDLADPWARDYCFNGDAIQGFGYDWLQANSLIKQARVFASSATQGMAPYLWEMSYDYSQPFLQDLWKTQSSIAKRAQAADRSSGAQVALVMDPELYKYFSVGFNKIYEGEWINEAGFAYHLVNMPMYSWGRYGAPMDGLFLDQIEQARKYKVYVFFYTLALSDDKIARIHAMLKRHNAMGIFVYADGMLDGQGRLPNTNNLGERVSLLTKMKVKGVPREYAANGSTVRGRSSELSPTPEFEALIGRTVTPTELDRWRIIPNSPSWGVIRFFPSFTVEPNANAGEVALARYREDGAVAIAEKRFAAENYSVVYAASPEVPPQLMRELFKRAGVHLYSHNNELTYANRSFVGVTTPRKQALELRLRRSGPLYDVLRDTEYPSKELHVLQPAQLDTRFGENVSQPYWFFRGTRAQWCADPAARCAAR